MLTDFDHILTLDCPCQPRQDFENNLIIHNAFDNREFDEIAHELNEEVGDGGAIAQLNRRK